MTRNNIRTIIVLAMLSLVGLVITQFIWISKAYELQEKQFDDKAISCLSKVVDEILIINKDTTQYVEAIQKQEPNYFVAAINDTLHPYLLESLLKAEFEKQNFKQDFEYGIYDCFTDSMVYENYISFENEKKASDPPQIKWDVDAHYFGVYFPNKTTQVLAQIKLWLISTLVVLAVIIFFTSTIFIVFRQRRLSEVKTDFINNMTHELKTPISTISLSSEALLKSDNYSEERIKKYADIIFSENKRLQHQVERVLQLTKLNRGKIELKKQLFNINNVIQEAIKAFSFNLENQLHEITNQLDPESSELIGDELHLSNVIYNLLENAIKYSGKKINVNITSRPIKQGIEVTVADRGIGIPKKDLKQIFEQFYRVPKGNVHDVKGFGLGLYYVKRIIDAHHGWIKVESEVNQGSSFIFWIPKA